ncbi:MAG: 1-acyl-sn-glycerol-3-phosphate acyltransferase [Clostridia bacterium]|nr:1-acyl-sn-glycerol-3-phosphate acyltransferase [Clostridia bacterium]
MYSIIRKIIIFVVCKILFRVEYQNEENLKKYDKCLICPNHSRIYDPVFIYPKIENIYGMAKSELFAHKLVANFLKYHNIFPVDREKSDTKSLRKALKLLKDNENMRLLIFPEGKVLKDKKERGIVKNGAVYIAAMANVPIVPIYITARPKYFSKVVVKFGNLIFYDKLQLKDKSKIEEASKQLLKEIYTME